MRNMIVCGALALLLLGSGCGGSTNSAHPPLETFAFLSGMSEKEARAVAHLANMANRPCDSVTAALLVERYSEWRISCNEGQLMYTVHRERDWKGVITISVEPFDGEPE